ncbi:ABC-type transport auxiliary lipoprotein family protein [Alicycliphilus denitrificans]|uniref:ABC-type transport auxiliary lipoprotein family protein n=1 Tax=Alicycliphilus denitrificans TaxID=179636 RepID=UPI00384B5938
MKSMKNIAGNAFAVSARATFGLVFFALAMAGCSVLPAPPLRADVYDFGPGPMQAAGAEPAAPLAPIVLAAVDTVGLPEGSAALLYRLAYANAQQLRPYTQARWSQPPADLLAQALRERLGQRRVVLSGDDGLALRLDQGRLPSVLRVQLEEFSQVFGSPGASAGLVRVRAMLADAGARGETLVAQRLFIAQRPAATPDAAGGARALADAATQVADELADWVQQQGR